MLVFNLTHQNPEHLLTRAATHRSHSTACPCVRLPSADYLASSLLCALQATLGGGARGGKAGAGMAGDGQQALSLVLADLLPLVCDACKAEHVNVSVGTQVSHRVVHLRVALGALRRASCACGMCANSSVYYEGVWQV